MMAECAHFSLRAGQKMFPMKLTNSFASLNLYWYLNSFHWVDVS